MRTLLLLCLLAGAAQAQPFQQDLLFYLSFDESPAATVARGYAYPTSSDGGGLVSGKKGKAWNSRAAFLNYNSHRNITNSAGTIAFWFKPNWESDGAISRYFFSWSDPEGDARLNSLSVYYSKDHRQVRTLIAPANLDANIDYARFEPEWKPGEWHHLAVTWQYPEIRMYLDGLVAAKGSLRSGIAVGHHTFTVGAYKTGTMPADAVLDEFHIYRRVLTQQEISVVAGFVEDPKFVDVVPLQAAFIEPAQYFRYNLQVLGEILPSHRLRFRVGQTTSSDHPWSDQIIFGLGQNLAPGSYEAVVSLMDGERVLSARTNSILCVQRPGTP